MIVGLIANPEAGHDVRRVVSHASTFSNQEKVQIIRRVLMGLAAAGVEQVAYLPDPMGLVRFALDGMREAPRVEPLEMPVFGRAEDSAEAARRLAGLRAACIVTLGGDGTNRVVAGGCGDVPLVPISTGTNNVFPTLVEGTIAGLAAGAVASGCLASGEAVRRRKRLEIRLDDEPRAIALVDVAVTSEPYTGARAVWEPEKVDEILITRAEAGAVGLSAIGGQLLPQDADDPDGLFVRVGRGNGHVMAAIAPGLIRPVSIAEYRRLRVGDGLQFDNRRGTLALDGEREIEFYPRHQVDIRLSAEGPYVVDIAAAMRAAAEAKFFQR